MKQKPSKVMGVAAPAPRPTWQAAFLLASLLSMPLVLVSRVMALWP